MIDKYDIDNYMKLYETKVNGNISDWKGGIEKFTKMQVLEYLYIVHMFTDNKLVKEIDKILVSLKS